MKRFMPPTTSLVVGGVTLLVGVAVGLLLAPVLAPGSIDTISSTSAASGDTTAGATGRAADVDDDLPTQGPTVEPSSPRRREAAPDAEPAPPLRFHSRRLRVDVPVTPIAASAGVLLPPGDPQQLGWWNGGAEPGSGRGRVLITGHTVQAGGGAFDDLARLRIGDVVDVRTATGTRHYAVTLIQYLTIEDFARRAPELLRATGPERLVLVTCDGWDGESYEGSTVVIAEPVAGRRR